MRLAFHGVGDHAQPYLDALRTRADIEIVAVCDLHQRAAEQVAAGWNAQVFPSYESMLDQPDIEALWVCVPPRLQGDVLLRAAQRRLPVLVTPPGAVDFARACLYDEVLRKAGVVTAVGFTGRHADVAQEAREYLGGQRIPLAVGWWLAPPEQDGSNAASALLWAAACRLVDTMRHLCGEVERVRAVAADAGALVLQLEFAGGTVGMLTAATHARPAPRIELELLGEGWSLVLGKELATLRLDEQDRTTILRGLNNPVADITEKFLQAVVAGRPNPSLPDYANALQTLAVCHAALRSAAEGQPITLASVVEQPESSARTEGAGN